jgi:hypothetical protein
MTTEQNTGNHRRSIERRQDAEQANTKRITADRPVCPQCGGVLYQGWYCEAHDTQS